MTEWLFTTLTFSSFDGKAGIPESSSYAFDPHLEYDHASERWFAIAIINGGSANSSVLVGVSNTSDPSAGWKGLIIDADPSDLRWAYYLYLGIDAAAIYVRLPMPGIADNTLSGATLLVLPKIDLTGAHPVNDHLSRFSVVVPEGIFEEHLASDELFPGQLLQIDYLGTASGGLQLSRVFLFSQNKHWKIFASYQKMTGQASGGAPLGPWEKTRFKFDSATNPPLQPGPADVGRQPGTDHLLGYNHGNNHIRVGDSVYSVTDAAVGSRRGIIWSRFQPSTNMFVDAEFIGDDTHDYLDISIAANADADVVIAYTRTGPEEYASLYCLAGRMRMVRFFWGRQCC